MLLTIIKPATLVIDGQQVPDADLSTVPADVYALNWNEDFGQIEYDNSNCRTPWDVHRGNDYITQLPDWANQIVASAPAPQVQMMAMSVEDNEQAKRDAAMAAGAAKQAEREAAMIEQIVQRMKTP